MEALRLPPQFRLEPREEVTSTLETATALARAGAEEGTLVWAGRQRDARTRLGRRWEAPTGNLHCAVVFRPGLERAVAAQLAAVCTLAAGTALAQSVEPMTGLSYRWPAGIELNGLRAVATNLVVGDGGPVPEWVVFDLSVNVGWHPPNPEPEAFVSVHATGAVDASVGALLEDFARQLLRWTHLWTEQGFPVVRRHWMMRGPSPGVELALELPERDVRAPAGEASARPGASTGVEGRVIELDEGGALVLEQGGSRRRITVERYYGWPGA